MNGLNSTASLGAECNCSLKIKWMDSDTAASYLGLSVNALRNMCSNGQLTYYKLGRRNRYRKSDLDKLLLDQKRGGLHGL